MVESILNKSIEDGDDKQFDDKANIESNFKTIYQEHQTDEGKEKNSGFHVNIHNGHKNDQNFLFLEIYHNFLVTINLLI